MSKRAFTDKQFEKMRQDFVANVSHELRTPLTVFRGYLEILLEETGKQKGKKHWKNILTQMSAQSTRMERIIEDLLLLSRLEIDTLDVSDLEAIDMPQLLQHIYQDTLALSGDKKQHIHLKITGPHLFYGRKSELHSAFSNLAFNAVHYTPMNGSIWMSWYQDKKGVHFKVKDTGIGIESKHIPRLTERFYRVDAGRTRETGGTGLGLAIVKHVLLRHHARLSISSAVNKGSVFRCDFPATA
jgi:two-component system phosphate regulon sensor histidine kinase PhoR